MVKTVSLRNKTTDILSERKAELLKELQIPPGLIRASYVSQYLTCGKKNCRCKRGFKHGPFFYVVQCLPDGKIRKFLLKTPEQQRQARAGIGARAVFESQLDELSHINTELLRRGDLARHCSPN